MWKNRRSEKHATITQLACSALLLVAMQAGAQERMPPPKGPPMDDITMAVGLNDTQRTEVQAILEQHHAAMQSMHDAMRDKRDALDQQMHAKLAKVLTPEQLARFERWHQSHRPPPPPDGPGASGDRPGPADRPMDQGDGGHRPPPADDDRNSPPPPGNGSMPGGSSRL